MPPCPSTSPSLTTTRPGRSASGRSATAFAARSARRRYFRKGGDERTYQVHVFDAGDQENVIRHLALCDYLRSHEDARDEYAALKRSLARRFPYDIEGYCDGKDRFVRALEARALAC